MKYALSELYEIGRKATDGKAEIELWTRLTELHLTHVKPTRRGTRGSVYKQRTSRDLSTDGHRESASGIARHPALGEAASRASASERPPQVAEGYATPRAVAVNEAQIPENSSLELRSQETQTAADRAQKRREREEKRR
jgi:hypothetical protein